MYKEVFRYFIKLGLVGFGGPLALIANMQRDLVEQREWIDVKKFQNAFTLIKSMPGPIAFSTAVYLGKLRAKYLGAFLAGFGLILPSFVMMIMFVIFLEKFEGSPSIAQVMLGMQVGALAVIIISLRGLIKGYEQDKLFWILVPASIILNMLFPSGEPIIILLFGFALALRFIGNAKTISVIVLFTGLFVQAQADKSDITSTATLFKLVLVCLKSGAFVFGSGLAIVPLLEQEVVQNHHWLTHSQFLNALALGQITPGPVIITATAIGYYVFGMLGAVLGTVSILLPSFFHMSVWFPSAVEYLSRQKWIANFSRGAMAAVLGSILLSVFRLAKDLDWSITLAVVAIAALIATYSKKVPIWVIIPSCGLLILIKAQFS